MGTSESSNVDLRRILIVSDEGDYTIPYNLDGIIYEDYIDKFREHEARWKFEDAKWRTTPFDKELKAAIEVRKKEAIQKKIDNYHLTEEQIKGVKNAEMYLVQAVSGLVDGDLTKLVFHDGIDVDKGFFIGLKSQGVYITVYRLYSHIKTMVESFDGSNIGKDGLVFTINGEGYYFNEESVYGSMGTGFKVGETITYLAMKKAHDDKQLKEYNSDLEFTLSMQQVAILCRKKGEKLPFKPSERDEWINNSVKVLQKAKLTYGDIIRVNFFFQDFLLDYMREGRINIFGETPIRLNKVNRVVLLNGV